MKTVRGWLNVYRSGYYHRLGKPGMYDRHPGDLYPTEAAARADIDPDAQHLYIDTAAVVWIDPDDTLEANPADSVPTPLSVSKRELRVPGVIPSQIVGMRPLTHVEPLRTAFEERYAAIEESDDYNGPSYEEWKKTAMPVPAFLADDRCLLERQS